MIDLPVPFGFIAASAALIAVPGPNIAVIMATGMAHGHRAALTVVAGTTLAQAAQILLVVMGLSVLLTAWTWAFTVIKWAGIAYLVWLGISALRSRATDGEVEPMTGRLFLRGAATALANPKTMIFHAAFLPFFVDPAQPAAPQLAILATVFLSLALLIDTVYALAAGGLSRLFTSNRFKTLANRLSGGVMLVAAGWLALRREA